ncbi:MAG TPA: VWA domain-containing protein [Verrucomicrobiae bacterium]|jgi:hypothetical protein|nr:VWA domain-containing protein [Verrucomicrobiae bacterium]
MDPTLNPSSTSLTALRERWMEAWPVALTVWSKFTRLKLPNLCLTDTEAKLEGLTGSFAMIRLQDQSVVVSLPAVVACHVEAFPVEVLAHEIGHHILAPATLTEHARMIARIRWALPTVEQQAPMVANLYADLLINNRLQRSASLRIADVYRAIGFGGRGGAVWTLYLRIYEILWSLEHGSLGGGETTDRLEGDAWLGARLVRSYARDWLDGSGRFAALLLPHLLEDKKSAGLIQKLLDTRNAAAGGDFAGLTEEEAGERDGAIHPAQDPALTDIPSDDEGHEQVAAAPVENLENVPARGQAREPFQFGEILRAAGLNITDHDVAVRYYRERAQPYLVPFPSRRSPQSTDPLPEGLEPWDIGDALDEVDWFQSIIHSPQIVPGVTTVRRLLGTTEGREPKQEPLDLDLYVDSSGSMPNPQHLTSYPALAGAILCLSALRSGASVQATLWSGKKQFKTTGGFVRDQEAILRVLTGFFGGATAFPIHVLRETYEKRKREARPAHILMISDDGVSTMFDRDERSNSGWDIARAALERASGGGTLVLNLLPNWETLAGACTEIRHARDEQGWNVYRVGTLAELVDFARQFSRLRYGNSARQAEARRS